MLNLGFYRSVRLTITHRYDNITRGRKPWRKSEHVGLKGKKKMTEYKKRGEWYTSTSLWWHVFIVLQDVPPSHTQYTHSFVFLCVFRMSAHINQRFVTPAVEMQWSLCKKKKKNFTTDIPAMSTFHKTNSREGMVPTCNPKDFFHCFFFLLLSIAQTIFFFPEGRCV